MDGVCLRELDCIGSSDCCRCRRKLATFSCSSWSCSRRTCSARDWSSLKGARNGKFHCNSPNSRADTLIIFGTSPNGYFWHVDIFLWFVGYQRTTYLWSFDLKDFRWKAQSLRHLQEWIHLERSVSLNPCSCSISCEELSGIRQHCTEWSDRA